MAVVGTITPAQIFENMEFSDSEISRGFPLFRWQTHAETDGDLTGGTVTINPCIEMQFHADRIYLLDRLYTWVLNAGGDDYGILYTAKEGWLDNVRRGLAGLDDPPYGSFFHQGGVPAPKLVEMIMPLPWILGKPVDFANKVTLMPIVYKTNTNAAFYAVEMSGYVYTCTPRFIPGRMRG